MSFFDRIPGAAIAVVLLATSIHADATVFCVKNDVDLTTALHSASVNLEGNTIKIVAGTITPGNFPPYSKALAFDLDIEGGWSDDCATQEKDAALTVLDAAHPVFGGSALSLVTQDSGNITVRYLTFRHFQGTGAVWLQATGTGAGDLRLENCLFIDNAPPSNTSVIAVINLTAGTGATYFLDNAAIGNVMTGAGAVASLEGASAATTCSICANNNTVSGNMLSDAGLGAVYIFQNSSQTHLANNIFWDNGGADLYVAATGFHPVLLNNDVGAEAGATRAASSAGNVSSNPLFANAAAGNYRLRATSPVRDIGNNTPPGTIRNFDLDGASRIDDVTVDMGAYEYHDVIFAEGFEGN